MSVSVSWNARNLGSRFNVGAGNHHYILIVVGSAPLSNGFPTLTHSSKDFFTLGGFSEGGNMVFGTNNSSDVASAKECLDGTGFWEFLNPLDWGTQRHIVAPPNGDAQGFATEVCRLARNYEKNTAVKPHPYDLANDNCAAWVNTLFEVIGISESDRDDYGEFWGIDWGEEDPIPKELFD